MHVNQKVLIHNKFDILIHDVNTGELVGQFESYNIVLDQMWTRLCGGSSYFVNIHFGTGDGTLSAARTSLFAHLDTKAAADEEQVKALPVSRWKRKIVLNPEEYVGATITEVGIAFGATASNLVTHSKLKDAEGNPISLPAKTETQVITIYATVFVTLLTSDKLHFLSMPSNNLLVNYLIGGSAAPTTPSCIIGGYGERINISGFAFPVISKSMPSTTDVVNKKIKFTTLRFGISEGNIGRIQEVGIQNIFRIALPKLGMYENENISNVAIGTGDGSKTKFNIPSDEVLELEIKVNGSTVNDYVYYSGLVSNVKKPIAWIGVDPVDGFNNNPKFSFSGNYIFPYFERLRNIKGYKIGCFGSYYSTPTHYTRNGVSFKLQGSNDTSNWYDIVTITSDSSAITSPKKTILPASVDDYQYLRFNCPEFTNSANCFEISLWAPDESNYINFSSAKSVGEAITASYKTPYAPKTDQRVIDFGFSIQFGEGV